MLLFSAVDHVNHEVWDALGHGIVIQSWILGDPKIKASTYLDSRLLENIDQTRNRLRMVFEPPWRVLETTGDRCRAHRLGQVDKTNMSGCVNRKDFYRHVTKIMSVLDVLGWLKHV